MTAYNSLTALKTALDNTIKTNSANEITGNVMNSALDNIVDNVSAQSSLFPNFDLAIPKQTIEFDVATAGYFNVFTVANDTIVSGDVTGVAGFRVTGTMSGASQVIDIMVSCNGVANRELDIFGFNKPSTTASADAICIYAVAGGWPKAVNNSYPWYVNLYVANNTQRHIKIDVFYDTFNATWVTGYTANPYNETYHTGITRYMNVPGFFSLRNLTIDVQSATQAAYITSYLPAYFLDVPIVAGTAIAYDNLVFLSTDGKVYPVSTTNKAIRAKSELCVIGTSYAADATPISPFVRCRCTNSFASTSATYGTFAKGDEVYLRCSMNNGAIYSDGVLTNAMSAGYTWVQIGIAYSASGYDFVSGKPFLTLDANGKLTHVNGQEIAMPSAAMAVSTSTTLADNTYHKLSSAVGTQTFTLPTISDTASVHNIIIAFTTSSSPNITFSSSATIMYASDFALEASTTYEVNCLWNGTVWVITAFAYESAS